MGWLGQRALLYQDTRPVLERMRGFEGAPLQTLALTYEIARAVYLNSLGHSAEARHALEHASAMLDKKLPWQVTAHEQRDLRIGLLLLQGMVETLRERSGALECAAKLERIGTPLAIAASARIRMTYYLLRGDTVTAHHHRRLLELQAVESGSLWQVQWFSIPVEAMAAATWHDLVGLRRALGRLEQIVSEAPAMSQMYLSLRLPYSFHRGDYALTASLGEEYMRKYPAMTRVGWSPNYALTAFAYAHLGQPERALEICESALAQISDEEHEYIVLYAPLDAAYATALALTGQAARSREVFAACVERLRAAGEYLRAIVTHAYRLRAARLAGDDEGMRAARNDMRQTAAESGSSAAVELAQRLSEERGVQSNHSGDDDDLLDGIDTFV
jgi:tetratricopeptide (TPR) repeat protein